MDPRHPHQFPARHPGPAPAETPAMLPALGFLRGSDDFDDPGLGPGQAIDAFTDAVVPDAIRFRGTLDLPPALSERALLDRARALAAQNRVFRSYLGMGYHGTVTPPVILRNVLQNPGWYTQ